MRHTLTLDEARRIVSERMAQREKNFLRLVERGVYGYARSPYLPLLKMGTCARSSSSEGWKGRCASCAKKVSTSLSKN